MSDIKNHLGNSSPVSAVLINVFQEIQFCTSSYLLSYFKLVFRHQPKVHVSKSKLNPIPHFKARALLSSSHFCPYQLPSAEGFQCRTIWQTGW